VHYVIGLEAHIRTELAVRDIQRSHCLFSFPEGEARIVALPATAFGSDVQMILFHGARPSIEGVWDSTVTLQVCGSGPVSRTFRAINLFEHQGGLVATSEAVPPPSLGRWRWTVGRTLSGAVSVHAP
jgi:hypothetical protein